MLIVQAGGSRGATLLAGGVEGVATCGFRRIRLSGRLSALAPAGPAAPAPGPPAPKLPSSSAPSCPATSPTQGGQAVGRFRGTRVGRGAQRQPGQCPPRRAWSPVCRLGQVETSRVPGPRRAPCARRGPRSRPEGYRGVGGKRTGHRRPRRAHL